MSRDPRRAYAVVDAFEAELCDYTGAPFAVAVNSCTASLLLALTWERLKNGHEAVELPTRTYIGVLQSALNAGYSIEWNPEPWDHLYELLPTNVFDSARSIAQGMWNCGDWSGTFICLSFHVEKQLRTGGGAIITDNAEAADWFRAARMDGRPPGSPIEQSVFPGWHFPMDPTFAAAGLNVLSRWNDKGYSPEPLEPTVYPDLSLLDFSNSQNVASSNPSGAVPDAMSESSLETLRAWLP